MPAPAIIGIPWLAGVLGSIVTSVTAFFATRVAGRVAAVLGWITLYISMLAALSLVFVGLAKTIHYSMPDSLAVGIYMFLPSNLELCLSVYISARVSLWVYFQKTRVVQYMFDFNSGNSFTKR